jgi:hypothetical protein
VPLAASVGDVGKTQRENPLENHGKMGMKAKKLDFYSFFFGAWIDIDVRNMGKR